MPKINVKTLASYAGHTINKNKSISLTLKFSYETIVKYIQAIQMLNENVELLAKVGGEKIKLGSFMINNINIDHDGEGKIKFNSQIDYVELNSISKLIDTEIFKLSLSADVEDTEEEENEDEKYLPF